MSSFNTAPGFRHAAVPDQPRHTAHAAGDAFYAMLIEAHRDLSDAQSELLNARLVLLLANQIGDLALLQEAVRLARQGVDEPGADATP